MQLVKNVDIAWKEVEGQKAQLDSCRDVWELGGGFKYFLFVSLFEEMIQFD